MIKFWKWLYHLSATKIIDWHLNKYKSDIKCPNCNTWFSISSVEGFKHSYVKPAPNFGVTVTCGKCNHTSHWNMETPAIILCDETGKPL